MQLALPMNSRRPATSSGVSTLSGARPCPPALHVAIEARRADTRCAARRRRLPCRCSRRRRDGVTRCVSIRHRLRRTRLVIGAIVRRAITCAYWARVPPCSTGLSSGPSACAHWLSLRPSQNRNGLYAVPAIGIVRRFGRADALGQRRAVLELLLRHVARRARHLAVGAEARVEEQLCARVPPRADRRRRGWSDRAAARRAREATCCSVAQSPRRSNDRAPRRPQPTATDQRSGSASSEQSCSFCVMAVSVTERG